MKFRFLVPLYTPTGAIPEGDVRELSPDEVALYRGRNNDHLEPMDPEAAAFLKGEPAPEPPAEEKPRRGRPPKSEE